MKTITTIKQIIAYEQKCFVDEILKSIEDFESKGFETEIQYSYGNEKYTALIIGKKEKPNVSNKSSKTIR